MKLKNHSIGKKLISALLAILMVLSAFPITSFAASANLGEVSGAKDIDVTAEFNYGHEIHYGTVNGNKYPLFCIEYGTTSPSSSYLEGKKAMASSKAVDAAKWIFAGYYLEHGNAINKLDMAYCQKKVWSIMGDSTSWTFTDSGYQEWCDNAKSNMEKLNTYPSFDGKNIGTLVAGTSTTITDTNKVLSSYPAFTYTKSGVTATHEASKNTITISVSKDCTATSFALPANKYLKNNTGDDDELLLYYPYGSKSYQKLIYSAYYDPIDVSFNASITPLGSLKLVKTSEDGNVANIKFTITGKDFSKTVTTDSKGVIELAELVPGTYTITEQSNDRYEAQESKEVTIESNKTATVTFNNTLKKGNLKVQKNSEDSIVSGFTFSVKGSDGSSHSITTNSSGVATLNNLPVYDSSNNKITYTVAETSVPVRYVTPDNKTITLSAGSTSTATFNNVLKKGNIEIQKDCEDGQKSGLTFQITGSDGSSHTATTNASGIAKVNNLAVYDSTNNKITYTVKETNVPIRYTTPDNKTVKLAANETSTVIIGNKLKKGNVEIQKDCEDGLKTGLTFQVNGSDGSSYTATTNANGIAKINNLAVYDSANNKITYTVKETNVPIRYVTPDNKTVKLTAGETTTVTIDNKLKKGNIEIQKDCEDGLKTGLTFQITGSNGSSYTATTNASGIAKVNNLNVYDSNNNKITYTVKETNVPIRYVTPDNKTVKLNADETSTVAIDNKLKKGNIEIQKDCEDNKKSGLTFKVTGSDGSNYTVSTNANGVAYVPNIPVYDSNNNKISYTVKETSVPIRYVTPDDKVVKLNADETSIVQVNNILKKFKVEVTKVDIEKTHAQGDAKLMGAVYGIYDNDKLIDTYTTDKEGKFTTKYYVCGDNWSIKEITPSEGYNLDTTVYHVGAEAKNYTVERNTTANLVKEQVIKGKISIIKHTDDGSTKIETPEKGAEFQIYLKSAGSFAKAVDTEKDTIVCDEDGFASSKLLPYGVYTVHQTKGWAGREKIKDFDVFVSSEGKTYKFLINNANFMSYLKVVKVDNETGKNIAYEGAAFEIYDIDGHRVTMQYTYPQVTSIHTFYTNSEGYLITPEKLPYGDYTLVEVQAPYGYILDSTPIPFSITQENSSTDTGVTVVKVKARDVAQKGIIKITKTGEVFSTVTSECDMYTPQYEVQGLKDAIFEIFAAEDITTLDGTVRYMQGEKVDEITTNEKGIAESKALYLGKYTVVEKHAPNTFVNANKQYDVELEYAGQNITLTKTELELTNQRQKVEVSLKKILEENCLFGIGNNNEISKVVFGIFAHEQITAQDETFIPEDSLIATATCDTDGNIKFDCDLPIGFNFYVKEIATDEHYILDENKYEFSTEYQGETVETIKIEISEGADIKNKLIYGCVKGLKIDRETNEPVSGATFGLFSAGTTEFTKDTALMIAKSNSGGEFEFKMLPYGEYIIKELEPAKHYLANDSVYNITINENEQIIRLEVVNDMIPEMRTTATVEGEKTICATETFTLTDKVEYKHLIPNEEYIISGILMDKSTGKPFLVNGKEVTSEVTFTPTEPNGSIDILFIFDSTSIKTETDIVVFESLYKDGQELCVHADINDKDQTVKIKIPSIKTKATVDGKKRVTASKKITIIDTVSYKNLTIGKEYVIKGILMNKDTGKPFIVNGKEVTAEIKFIPETKDGEIEIKFEFDGSGIKKDVELVVFEALYRDGIELTTHADINDKGQTILIEAPKPKTPKTGDNKNYGTLFGLAFVAIGGCIAGVILKVKSRKEDEE